MFLSTLINHTQYYPERLFFGNREHIKLVAFELGKPNQNLLQFNTNTLMFMVIGLMTTISSFAIYKFFQLKQQFNLKLNELHYLQNSLDIKVQERISGLEAIIAQLENRLQQQQQQNRIAIYPQKVELLSKFSKGIAHNMNNLLTGVIGNINITLESMTPDQSQYLLKSRDAAIRASNIVNDLLNIVDSDCNNRVSTSIHDVLHDVIKTTPEVDAPQIEVSTQFKSDLPPLLLDQIMVKTALKHIIQNAHEAILNLWEQLDQFPHRQDDKFFIKITTDITQKALQIQPDEAVDQTFVEISIHDNGIGMCPTIKEQVFDPFFTTKETVGTGLGLVGSEKIILNHQGWIDFESQHGNGTIFKVYIPVNPLMM